MTTQEEILSDPNHPEHRDELQRLHDEHEANLELEADLHGTGTQMYKDTLMLLGRLKKECRMYDDTLALLGRLKKELGN